MSGLAGLPASQPCRAAAQPRGFAAQPPSLDSRLRGNDGIRSLPASQPCRAAAQPCGFAAQPCRAAAQPRGLAALPFVFVSGHITADDTPTSRRRRKPSSCPRRRWTALDSRRCWPLCANNLPCGSARKHTRRRRTSCPSRVGPLASKAFPSKFSSSDLLLAKFGNDPPPKTFDAASAATDDGAWSVSRNAARKVKRLHCFFHFHKMLSRSASGRSPERRVDARGRGAEQSRPGKDRCR